MSWILAAPLLIPLGASALALLSPRLGLLPRWISAFASALHLLASIALAEAVWREGVLATHMGGWLAPIGIVLVADTFSALMLVAASLVGLAVSVYALADIDRRREAGGWHALYQVLLAGATGAFLTGDLFNLYVWFEVMLIASFGLIVIGGKRAQIDAGVKYVALNVVATLAFLTAIGLIHGLTGTLTMAELPERLAGADPAAVTAVSLLLFGAFAAKAALFPVFFWLPAVYHTPSTAVTAIFAALMTKAGIYAIIRVFTLVLPEGIAWEIMLPIAILTMVAGVIGAAAQQEVHRILSFHIVSQIGYVALGLAIATPLALMGAIVYLIHNIIVKANLILIAGIARRRTGSDTLGQSGGLYAVAPFLSAIFLIAALAMAGIPPFSGFWGKLALTQASLSTAEWAAVAAILGVGLFTLFSMTKIWTYGWLPAASGPSPRVLPIAANRALMAPVIGLTVATLAIGLAPQPLMDVADRAAAQLLDPTAYRAAVLGDRS
ncbi:MAG: proton-conducting transporter membrane subunit [Pseudomonadota bacterium]